MPKGEFNWSHLTWGVGGALIGAGIVRNQLEEAKKSRAEKESPDDCEDVYENIGDLLDNWTPRDYPDEDGYVKNLHRYLLHKSEWEVELRPASQEGQPDLLIGGLLALEVKLNPTKGEMDRCIGQCAGYSRLWITWIVLVDTSPSKEQRLRHVLEDKGWSKSRCGASIKSHRLYLYPLSTIILLCFK